MVLAEGLTLITQAGKLFEQDAAIFVAVDLAEENGADFREHPFSCAEDCYLSPLDVALQKVRRKRCLQKIIQRNGLDANRTGGAAGNDVTQSTVRRSLRIGAGKKHGARFRPNGLLLDGNRGEVIALNGVAKTLGNLWIRFKRHDAPLRTDNPRSKDRKKPDVCPNIVKRHPRPEVPLHRRLHFRLAATLEIIAARAGIQAEPKAFGWSLLDLHPRQRVARHDFFARPTNK